MCVHLCLLLINCMANRLCRPSSIHVHMHMLHPILQAHQARSPVQGPHGFSIQLLFVCLHGQNKCCALQAPDPCQRHHLITLQLPVMHDAYEARTSSSIGTVTALPRQHSAAAGTCYPAKQQQSQLHTLAP